MYRFYFITVLAILLAGCGGSSSSSGSSNGGSSGVSGKGGSMARFAIKGDYLYTVNTDAMRIFDISEASSPQPHSKVHVPFDVETIFSYKDYLYIGAESGMYIYDINVPTQPTKIGDFGHVRSCDPVVVHDDLAFVTLNIGNNCRMNDGENSLQIIDVKNPSYPKLIKRVNMWSPSGLGVDNDNNLFICDGSAGLKVFKVAKQEGNETAQTSVSLNPISQNGLKDINCYDLILNDKNLIISNRKNIKQFDYSSFPAVESSTIK